MKTSQANLINSITLILMPLWSYLTYEGTVEKPDQSITALIPLFLGVILLLCHYGLIKKSKTKSEQELKAHWLGYKLAKGENISYEEFLPIHAELMVKKQLKKRKVISHIAVVITLIAIGGLSKPLMSAIEEGRNLGVFRVSLMVLTSVIAMITFVKSFIEARKK